MKKLNRLLKEYESLIALIGVVVTIISFFVCTVTISNRINANVSNTNANEINIDTVHNDLVEQKFYEAQNYYLSGDYGNAMRIYQEIQNKHATAKSNIGYLYAHGLGVEQDTRVASEYYRHAYEDGYEQALQNYISINLTAPYGYAKTLEALKYGYDKNNETAIRYLAAALCGKMPDLPMDELREMADEFMTIDEDIQLSKLKDILEFVNSEIVLLTNDNPPAETDFVKYVKTNYTTSNRKIISYSPVTDKDTNETFIVPINTMTEMNVYWKMNYSFYLGQCCPTDEFGKL